MESEQEQVKDPTSQSSDTEMEITKMPEDIEPNVNNIIINNTLKASTSQRSDTEMEITKISEDIQPNVNTNLESTHTENIESDITIQVEAKASDSEIIENVSLNANKSSHNPENSKDVLESTSEGVEGTDLVCSVTKKHRYRLVLDDSESDSELNIDKGKSNEQNSVSKTDIEEKIISTNPGTNHNKHKRITVFDSDSESQDQIITPHNKIDSELNIVNSKSDEHNSVSNTDIEENIISTNLNKHKRISVFDSDSESEDQILFPQNKRDSELNIDTSKSHEHNSVSNTDIEEKIISTNHNKHKRITVFDSDSEAEDQIITPHNKSFNDDTSTPTDNNDTANPKGEVEPQHGNILQKSRLAILCDSDSEDEVPRQNESASYLSEDEIIEQTQHEGQTSKSTAKGQFKKSKSKETENIPKKMTAKEAVEQRKEIQSESQRMLRERNISLPYHKPKSHSLKEFLARRPKLSRAMTGVNRAHPSVAMKMTTEQLEIMSKKLKEREKEVKEFYKSESESDNDDNDNVPPTCEETQLKETISVDVVPVTETETADANKDCMSDLINLCSENSSHENLEEQENRDQQGEGQQLQDLDSIEKPAESVNVGSNKIDGAGQNNIVDFAEDKEDPPNEFLTESPMDVDVTPNNDSEANTNSDLSEKPLQTCLESNSDVSCQIMTESYDFNLEDENTEKNDIADNTVEKENANTEEVQLDISDDSAKKQTLEEKKTSSSNFTYTDLDREIENFGESEEVFPEENRKETNFPQTVKSKLELLKQQLANDRPRLSGGPNDVIDLECGVAKPREVVQLMERFAKHVSAKKHHSKHKVKLSIVTVESGGDIHKEEVAMNVDSDEDDKCEQEEIPGAKLHKLKVELQKQMEQSRSELWQQRALKGIRGAPAVSEDVENGEKDILSDYDDEEEAEMTDDDSDEELEDDIELTDKPRIKSTFLDQEAEISDEDAGETPKEGYEDEVEDNDVEDDEENNDDESERIEGSAEDSEDSNMSSRPQASEEPVEGSGEKKKVLKRIVKPVDDSDEEDLFNDSNLQTYTANAQLDSTVTADEDEFPSHQPRQLQTPIRPAISQTKSISDFLTPISFITSIQNLTSASKAVKDGSAVSPFRMPMGLLSPEKEAKAIPQKKLFTDSAMLESQGSLDIGLSQTQESLSDLRQATETEPVQETQSEYIDEAQDPNTQDLLGICSGQFTGVTQLEPTENTGQNFGNSQSCDLKSLGQDDMIISQLLDEEELENFKKKFESPVNPVSQRSTVGEAEEIIGGGVIDSDDEDEGEGHQKKRKTNHKRIQFSDDESSDEENGDNEEIDLQDRDGISDDDADAVGYDSEENEIDLNTEAVQGKKEKIKLADFLEAEAELSESEWGSADEDEKDLDQMEFELGDTDKFDENKMKSDLEKIHMRRLLDDDTREVKMLQEMLLEDGEMHGTGRQRQFKWKNIDSNNDEVEEKKDDDEIYLDEEESEEQWRKKRHEREMFLKSQQENSQNLDSEEDLLCTSEVLKIGHKFLQRSMSGQNSLSNTPTETSKTDIGNSFNNTMFSLQNKRGSFLNRSDQVLQRIASYTKVNSEGNSASRKTTKHFLFQSVSATEESMSAADSKKRKAAEGTPNVLKKLRLSTNLSPAIKKKLDKPERSKKLFNF